MDLAEWRGFQTACTSTNVCINIEDIHSLTAAITSAATEHIPRTGGLSAKPLLPFWNNAVKDAIREKLRALNKYKHIAPT